MRTPTSEGNIPSPKFDDKSIMAVALTICISCGGFVPVQHAYSESPIKVIAQPPFTGSDGKLNVVVIKGESQAIRIIAVQLKQSVSSVAINFQVEWSNALCSR
jgi:hypothetical protein